MLLTVTTLYVLVFICMFTRASCTEWSNDASRMKSQNIVCFPPCRVCVWERESVCVCVKYSDDASRSKNQNIVRFPPCRVCMCVCVCERERVCVKYSDDASRSKSQNIVRFPPCRGHTGTIHEILSNGWERSIQKDWDQERERTRHTHARKHTLSLSLSFFANAETLQPLSHALCTRSVHTHCEHALWRRMHAHTLHPHTHTHTISVSLKLTILTSSQGENTCAPTCTHTHTHMCVRAHTHTHARTQTCTTSSQRYRSARPHKHTHSLCHTHTHTHTHTHGHKCTHDLIAKIQYARPHTHTPIYTHKHARTHTHTHTTSSQRERSARPCWVRDIASLQGDACPDNCMRAILLIYLCLHTTARHGLFRRGEAWDMAYLFGVKRRCMATSVLAPACAQHHLFICLCTHVWHDWFVRGDASWKSDACADNCLRVKWMIHVRSFKCVTWRIHVWS